MRHRLWSPNDPVLVLHPSATIHVCSFSSPTAIAVDSKFLIYTWRVTILLDPSRYRLCQVGFSLLGGCHIWRFYLCRRSGFLFFLSFWQQGIMDRTSRSTRRSTTLASSIPEATPSLDTTSAYSSPVSSTAQGRCFPTTVGLGISGCGLEAPFHPMIRYSSQSAFSTSSAMPNTLMSTENIYNLPLDADDFCGRSCYEIYNGLPDPSQSSLNFYGTRPISMTHDYDPVMEVGTGQGMFPEQMNGMPVFWTNTPVSGPPTPLQSIPVAADRPMDNQWNQEIYPDANFHSQSLPHSRAFYPPIPLASESNASGATRERHTNAMPNVPVSQSISASESAADAASKTSKRGRKPSAEKGCKCPVCGFYFTRRSNCVAHQKKHDPTFHRAIPCEECSKSFGRNADLRRHVDTVSRELIKR